MAEDILYFNPLYFIFHDCWSFRTWRYNLSSQEWKMRDSCQHRGHVHFFMPEHRYNTLSPGKAYSGSQMYSFSLAEDWSPNSSDPNQTKNLKVIGLPKWYFYVKEYWRRVYIQEWDSFSNSKTSAMFGRKGVKWDASRPEHTFGPFREGKDNFFYWTNMARTLPVEYFLDEKKKTRDHYLRYEAGLPGNLQWDVTAEGFDASTRWTIPRTFICGSPDNFTDGDPLDYKARCFGYPDSNYIYPTIEYQSVEHLNWERLPGSDSRPDGDGYSINISIPFKDADGIIQSPFSDDGGNVGVPGSYFHGFESRHPEKVLKYASTGGSSEYSFAEYDKISHNKSDYDIPEGKAGLKMDFNVPSHMEQFADGIWVEQCLGAVVLGRAEVTVEDNFGGRYTVYVKDTQFMVRNNFEGSDQDA